MVESQPSKLLVAGPIPVSRSRINNLTLAEGINPAGVIGGYYLDGNNLAHGFVRDCGGTLTTFDAPGPVNGTYVVLNPINASGAIAGFYYDGNYVSHGFLRARRYVHDLRCSGRGHGRLSGHRRIQRKH